MPSRGIQEIEGLYLLEDLAEEYESQNGLQPFNLSHWDPSEQTTRLLLQHLRLPPPPIGVPYIYSYSEGKEEILRRLGFLPRDRRCWFFNAGTTAVLLGAWWLKAQASKRLVILGPTYFPIFHVCEAVQLPYVCLYMRRVRGRWQLPREEIASAVKAGPGETALWVTNPVFSTGCYLLESDTAFLASMLSEGATVVADECLSINERELGQTLGSFEQFLGLYSPHKALSINSTKFAAMVYDRKYEDFFDGWTDVLAGPLASSTYSAILHFLGENFPPVQRAFFGHVDAVREDVVKLIKDYADFIETDVDSLGNFITCYARGVPGHNGHDEAFLRDLIWSTGVTLIPGVRSRMDPELGFSFRINLARAGPQFYAALRRIAEYLARVSTSSPKSST